MRHHSSLEQRLQVLEQRRQETEQYSFSLSQWRAWNSTGQRGQIIERLSPENQARLVEVGATLAMFEE